MRICVFASSSDRLDGRYLEEAHALGRLLGEGGHTMIYGGGAEGFKVFYAAISLEDKLGSAYEPCIFAALNSAKVMLAIGTKPEYFNAVWVKNEWSRFLKLIAGGEVIGIAPRFFDQPGVLFEGCSRLVLTDTMAERKTAMEEEAEGFLILPGGIGTMEEFFEVLTQRQLGLHAKPMALLNTAGCYTPLCAMLRRMAETGFAGSEVPALAALCETPAEALLALTGASPAAARGCSRADYFR